MRRTRSDKGVLASHCLRGHAFTEDNTRWHTSKGITKRDCCICARLRVAQPSNRAKKLVWAKTHREQIKDSVFALLGNKCVVCHWSDKRALQVDHKNGGGNQERKELGGSLPIYKRVLQHPNDYQLLCANHNWIKRFEEKEHGGYGR